MTDLDEYAKLSDQDKLIVDSFKRAVAPVMQNYTKSDCEAIPHKVLFPIHVLVALKGHEDSGIIYLPDMGDVVVACKVRRGKEEIAVPIFEYFGTLCNGSNAPKNTPSDWGKFINRQNEEICANLIVSRLYHTLKEHAEFRLALLAVRLSLDMSEWEDYAWELDKPPKIGPTTFETWQAAKKATGTPSAKKPAARKNKGDRRGKNDQEDAEKEESQQAELSTAPEVTAQVEAAVPETQAGQVQPGIQAEPAEPAEPPKTEEPAVPEKPAQAADPDSTPSGRQKRVARRRSTSPPAAPKPRAGTPPTPPAEPEVLLNTRRRSKRRRNGLESESESDSESDSDSNSDSDASSDSDADGQEQEDEDRADDIEDIVRKYLAPEGRTSAQVERDHLKKFYDTYLEADMLGRLVCVPPKKVETKVVASEGDRDTVRFIADAETSQRIKHPQVTAFLSQEFAGESGPCKLHSYQAEYCSRLYGLYKHGPSKRFAVLSAEMGAGKSVMTVAMCLLLMEPTIDHAELRREFCVVFCPPSIIAQWAGMAKKLCADAAVYTPDTNDPYLTFIWTKMQRDIKAGRKVFLIMTQHVLGQHAGVAGNDPFKNVYTLLRNKKCLIVADEAHNYLRHAEKTVSTNMNHLLRDYKIGDMHVHENLPLFLMCTGTPVKAVEDAKSILCGLFDIPNLPVKAISDKDTACKVLNSLQVPDAYELTAAHGDCKVHVAQYVFKVPESFDPSGERNSREAHKARNGTGEDPFEYQPSLYAIVLATLQWMQHRRSVVIFNENLQGIKTLMRYLQQTDFMKDFWFFMHGDMGIPERERMMEGYKAHGGVLITTPQLMQVGTNDLLDVAGDSVHFMITVGAPSFRKGDKDQQAARCARQGQKHPAVLSIYIQSHDDYTVTVQEVTDKVQGKLSGATSKTVVYSKAVEEGKDRRQKNSKRKATDDQSSPKRRPRILEKVVELELADLGVLAAGLLELANRGAVLNLKNAGFEVDPDSKLMPLETSRQAESKRYFEMLQGFVWSKYTDLNAAEPGLEPSEVVEPAPEPSELPKSAPDTVEVAESATETPTVIQPETETPTVIQPAPDTVEVAESATETPTVIQPETKTQEVAEPQPEQQEAPVVAPAQPPDSKDDFDDDEFLNEANDLLKAADKLVALPR